AEEKYFTLTIEDSMAFNFPNGNKIIIEIQKTKDRLVPHGEIDLIVRTFAIQEKKEVDDAQSKT
ncbi:hypothetical protein KKH13_04945, partial [Patescibacteria group bacterium]|nr:hypothetical protein [Patescibacteria group bacterium]